MLPKVPIYSNDTLFYFISKRLIKNTFTPKGMFSHEVSAFVSLILSALTMNRTTFKITFFINACYVANVKISWTWITSSNERVSRKVSTQSKSKRYGSAQ